jgi:subfamily B ATP-binding cassette protein MsbA
MVHGNQKIRLLGAVLRHGPLLGQVLGLTALYGAVSGLSLGMVLPFVNLLFDGGSAAPAALPADSGGLERLRFAIQDRAAAWFFAGTPQDALRRICLFLVGAFALKGLFGFLLDAFSVKLEERVLKDFRDGLFTHLQTLSMGWFAGRRAGDLMSRATNDVAVVRKAVSSLYRTAPRDGLLVVVYLAIVFLASWRLALLCLVVLPLLAVFIGLLGARIRRQSARVQARMADLSSVFHETIAGIRVVKAFGAEQFVARRFLGESHAYLRSAVRLRRIASLASPAAEFLGAVGAVIVLWAGGNQVLSGSGLSSAWFVIFLAAMISLMQPVRSLTQLHTHLEEGDAALARIYEILDTVPRVADRAGAVALPGLTREIAFEDVSFEYDEAVPVLREVSLVVPRGHVVALVGPSGSGKSTLVDMLPRFHDPERGRVTLDGVDLRDVTLASLRAALGIVTQETILFHDTIAANIAFADANPDRARIVEAARAANAHEFIERAPAGYDTVIGERGVKLSGGERQRIAIARAIYRDPQILVFDEATSALDSESEAKVQEAIDRLLRGRTVLIIAHRLSTVRHADSIVVLQGGRIVETGRHDDLLARGGLYAKLCRRQFGAADPVPVA